MNRAIVLLLACPLLAAGPPSGFPFADESLSYTIVWPSGLSLGEAKLKAVRGPDTWNFDLTIDASVPGYPVNDAYHSESSANLCAAAFSRTELHGTKRTKEQTAIADGKAVRETIGGGGKTDIAVDACAHDALTFLFYARRELGQGRVPSSEKILFGGAYPIQLDYTGEQTITVGDKPAQADRVFCTVTGRGTQKYSFEVFFARDAARTPLLIRAPFALGSISMELVR
jgi:hypothetical protein